MASSAIDGAIGDLLLLGGIGVAAYFGYQAFGGSLPSLFGGGGDDSNVATGQQAYNNFINDAVNQPGILGPSSQGEDFGLGSNDWGINDASSWDSLGLSSSGGGG